jgi:hypothetical protein
MAGKGLFSRQASAKTKEKKKKKKKIEEIRIPYRAQPQKKLDKINRKYTGKIINK